MLPVGPLFLEDFKELWAHQDSDLHIDVNGIPDRTVLPSGFNSSNTIRIFSGDLRSFNVNQFRSWCESLQGLYAAVFFTMGNHDYWSSNIDTAVAKYRGVLPPGFHILTHTYPVLITPSLLIVGDTLWTDMNHDPMAELDFGFYMNDCSKIRIGETYSRFTGPRAIGKFISQSSGIIETINEFRDKQIVISTHHAPSLQSLSPRYVGSKANAYYASNLEWIMNSNDNISHWFHGHVHDRFDYLVNKTRVMCNPRGYYTECIDELDVEKNRSYDPLNLVRLV
jgi:predicted MPP superfamily phosphohydrolase